MNRRRSLLRRAFGPLFALAVVALSASLVLRTCGERDLVGEARALRLGDPAAGRERNPVDSLDLLQRLLQREPENAEALLELARAWADLRGWDKAIEALDRAVAVAPTLPKELEARIMAMNFLAIADRFDEAVQVGAEIVALQPDNRVHALRLGRTFYRGSLAAQQTLLLRFTTPTHRRPADTVVEAALEAAITDIWSEPDLPALVAELTPGADQILRQQITAELAVARHRFVEAERTLSGYRHFGGFDPLVAVAWSQVLQRTGRYFEAHLEAALALNEASLNAGQRKDFLEVQAACAIAVGDHGQAAKLYQQILRSYESDPSLRLPVQFVWHHYEQRVAAQHWDWILANFGTDVVAYGDDAVLRWALAAALEATGRTQEAENTLREPFASVSLGTRAFSPPSLRLYPPRRRAIAMLAYRLFSARGDLRAATALDAILIEDPRDVEVLRLRSDLYLSQGRIDPALTDAFALLRADRRDRDDFDRWLAAADRLSEVRHGAGLVQRATSRVEDSVTWMRSQTRASQVAFQTFGTKRAAGRQDVQVDQLFLPQDPAFSWSIVRELIDRGMVERARTELRKLSDAFPQVQEFRLALGQLLVREGQFEFAASEFKRLLEEVPGDALALELAMRAEIALGRRHEAARLVTEVILRDPLGVGAVRYGLRLLERGRADQAQKLVERIDRWTDYGTRTDVLFLAARTALAQGRLEDVETLLVSLASQYPDAFEIGLLALDLGVAREQSGLVAGALVSLQPLVGSLFPDQMEQLAARLAEAGLHAELVSLFPEEVLGLPAARPALRHVAGAWLALGNPAEAAAALAHLPPDRETLIDRFLLLALPGRADEASRALRLAPGPDALRPVVDLLLAVGHALMDVEALRDASPLERLRQWKADEWLGPSQLELLDGLLRVVPALARVDDVRPEQVASAPRSVYPHAGGDVDALVALARRDRLAARRLGEDLLALLLMGPRPLWERSARQIAEHAVNLVPGLAEPARTLARRALEEGRPRDALGLLQPLLLTEDPDPEDLRLFVTAAADFERADWGVALALYFGERPGALAVLAEALAGWGHLEEARELFEQALGLQPELEAARIGLVGCLARLRRTEELVRRVQDWSLELLDRPALAQACAAALAAVPRPDETARELMTWIWRRSDGLLVLGDALARAHTGDPDSAAEVLAEFQRRAEAIRIGEDEDHDRELAAVLMRAARTARLVNRPDIARALSEMALSIEPGAILLYRELAFLELEQGRLVDARNYLEVLSFVDLGDREAAMTLALLDFQQLGQPTRAAAVVRRSFTNNPPPEMVEILAAEAWLLGRPTEALEQFYTISASPLVSMDIYWTVARIALAAGQTDVARALLDLFQSVAPDDDPRRARAEFLRSRVAKPASTAALAAPR